MTMPQSIPDLMTVESSIAIMLIHDTSQAVNE